jgi:hypothetical protein
MTPEERELITGLFDRMRGFSVPEKDAEAEALINQSVVSMRDAPYMLVQSVLVQEHALQQADARIRELEAQVNALESAAQQRPAAEPGSFLGGLFGGASRPEPARDAARVPAIGSRATPSVYGDRQGGMPQQPSQPPAGPFGQAAQPDGGGGFMRTAMATAAGVAGGMLLGSAIGSLLSGNSAHAGAPQTGDASSTSSGGSDQSQTAAQDTSGSDARNQQDDGYHTASDDGDWFGGDGGDFDI